MFKVKIIKLQGGLGNQMFQYAFGKVLEKKLSVKILFDTFSYKKQPQKRNSKLSQRDYELGIFDLLQVDSITSFQLILVKIVCCISKIFHLPFFVKYKEKKYSEYNVNLLKEKKYLYYIGYFQNEFYYQGIKDELKKIFRLPPLKENDKENYYLLKKIEQTNNSVFIHVRRDDYVSLDLNISDIYYKKAVAYIKQRVPDACFFVFCAEDVDYIKKHFDIGVEFEIIGEKNKTRENYYENMRLMMACKHAIIANSSYSWWAAYLSDQEEKIVIAPSPWLEGCDDIICHNWVKIEAN